MAIPPNKSVVINIDDIPLDTWVALEELAEMQGTDRQPKVRDMRAILIGVLSEWTPKEVGALNITELYTIIGQITASMAPKPQP